MIAVTTILQRRINKVLLFYINDIMDLVDKVNSTLDKEFKQLTIYDVLEDVDDLNNEDDLKKAIQELELRTL